MIPWKTASGCAFATAWLLVGEAHAQHRRRHRNHDTPDDAMVVPVAMAPPTTPAPVSTPAPPPAAVAAVAYAQPQPLPAPVYPATPPAPVLPSPAVTPPVAPEAPPIAPTPPVRQPPSTPVSSPPERDPEASTEPESRPVAEAPSDHSRVVGHLGIGLLGVTALPYPGGVDESGDFVATRAIGSTHTIDAPTLGVRYWFRERLGLDVGVGVALGSSGGVSFGSGRADTDAPGDSRFALSLHGGLPVVLFHGRHYKFLVIPEVNIGFASGGDDGRSATDLNDNSSYSGFLFEAGGRVGAEVHFGFLGLPYLAMQASVGLALRYESRTYESAASSGTTGTRFALNSGRNFDLDSIFLHGLGLILYLP